MMIDPELPEGVRRVGRQLAQLHPGAPRWLDAAARTAAQAAEALGVAPVLEVAAR